MEIIQNYISGLEFGNPINYKNLSIAPLIGSNGGSLRYLTLTEAVSKGFVIEEIKGGARIPELGVENKTGQEVLGIIGECLKGGMQTRVLTRNVYFAKNFSGKIPVACVEQGRWRYDPNFDFNTGVNEPVLAGQKRSKPEFSMAGRASPGIYYAQNQHETWNCVQNSLASTGSHSGTDSLMAVYEQRNEEFKKYVESFSKLENQVGAVAAFTRNDKKHFIADVFDRSSVFGIHFDNLIKSYVLEAGLNNPEQTLVTSGEIKGFLDSVDSCEFESLNPISLGDDYKIKGVGGLEGSALAYNGLPVYLNLFVNPKEKNSGLKTREEQEPVLHSGPRVTTDFSRNISGKKN